MKYLIQMNLVSFSKHLSTLAVYAPSAYISYTHKPAFRPHLTYIPLLRDTPSHSLVFSQLAIVS